MLPEASDHKTMSLASELNFEDHNRKRESIRRELEVAQQEARRALAETRVLLQRADELLGKATITSLRE